MNTNLYQLNRDVTFTLTALNADESLLADYVKKQINIVNDFYQQYDALNLQTSSIHLEKQNVTSTVNSVEEHAVKLLRELSFRIKSDLPNYKTYFPKTFTKTIRTRKTLLKGYQHLLTMLTGTLPEALAALKTEAETVYDALLKEVNGVTNVKTDQKMLKEELTRLYKEWSAEYQRLKLLVRAQFFNTKIDYHIFFDPKKGKKTANKNQSQKTIPEPTLPDLDQ